MRTIFKQSLLELMSEEIDRADMNNKIISYFELTEDEYTQLMKELKMSGMRFLDAKVYGIPVVNGEIPF